MVERLKLPCGCKVPIIPLGEDRIEALLVIVALARRVCFQGDGDFANGPEVKEDELQERIGECNWAFDREKRETC